MTLLGMAWRSVRARRGVTVLTLLGIALATALPCGVLLLREQAEHSLLREGAGVDLVVGGKGSPLQLVLSVVHHLDVPTGNIPLSVYESLRQDRRIVQAVPLSLGDNVGGFRIVGTTHGFFDWRPRDHEGEGPWLRLREGTLFGDTFDAVLGAEAAARLGLGIGDSFVGSHGLQAAPGTEHDDFPYRVTGILERTGGSVDRLVFSTLQSVWDVHEAEEALHRGMFGAAPRTDRVPEVTAVWLRLRSPGMRLWIRDEINRSTDAMAAVPVDELHRLYRRVLRPVERGMLWMAGAVAVVSGFSVLATLLQSTDRRRRDWAVLRTLGAHPREIFALVWMEAFWLSTLGVALGVVAAHGGLALGVRMFEPEFLSGFDPFHFAELEGRVILMIWMIGMFCGLVPAWVGYRRSPVEDLSREV
jgi:putative ABC transport system permease protein